MLLLHFELFKHRNSPNLFLNKYTKMYFNQSKQLCTIHSIRRHHNTLKIIILMTRKRIYLQHLKSLKSIYLVGH